MTQDYFEKVANYPSKDFFMKNHSIINGFTEVFTGMGYPGASTKRTSKT